MESDESDPRTCHYRFDSPEIGRNPGGNVLLPEGYRGKRVFLAARSSPDPVNRFDRITKDEVRLGQREFRAALDEAGITYEGHGAGGDHFILPDLVQRDLDGTIERLRSAG